MSNRGIDKFEQKSNFSHYHRDFEKLYDEQSDTDKNRLNIELMKRNGIVSKETNTPERRIKYFQDAVNSGLMKLNPSWKENRKDSKKLNELLVSGFEYSKKHDNLNIITKPAVVHVGNNEIEILLGSAKNNEELQDILKAGKNFEDGSIPDLGSIHKGRKRKYTVMGPNGYQDVTKEVHPYQDSVVPGAGTALGLGAAAGAAYGFRKPIGRIAKKVSKSFGY
tara:strand:+ start:54 stop:719 length:666 start_codon:yes stop_codon:yes gene_type:complete